MTTSKITLNLPTKQPVWGSGDGRTTEPSAAIKAAGDVEGKAPAAKFRNWLHNLQNQWIKRIGAHVISNYFEPDRQSDDIPTYSPAHDVLGVIFHPSLEGGSYFCTVDENFIYKAGNLRNWSLVSSGAAYEFVQPRCLGITATTLLVGIQDTSAPRVALRKYDGSTVSTIAVASGVLTPTSLMSKYPDSDAGIVLTSSAVYYNSNMNSASGWTTPTTPPSSVNFLHSVIWIGGNSWVCVDGVIGTIKLYKSTNNSTSWQAAAVQPTVGTDLVICNNAAYNPNTGRLVLVGGTSAGAQDVIVYTDTLGDSNWTQASILTEDGCVPGEALACVYYCGGGLWLAAGEIFSSGRPNVLASWDDAATWAPVEFYTVLGGASADKNIKSCNAIACNGQSMLIVGDDIAFYQSLA